MSAAAARQVVVGVAGHIDHGKSTLVRALTGTDPDRLPEEKRRGITIDLGFAHLDHGGLSLSFVDAPGHEKLVHNMLAGATGVDLLLLVVAADESVMPQTREHLGICRLLGLSAGVVALTRVDLAGAELAAVAEDEVRQLVQGTFLDSAPIVRVSGVTGEGLPELLDALVATARSVASPASGPWPRVPIDRVFVSRGFGTVVTGSLSGGILRVGQTLAAAPGSLVARVRGLQIHNESVAEAGPRGRVAVNLQGVEREQLTRGMVLTPPDRVVAATVFDASVEALADAPAELTDGLRVRVHHGAAEIMGRLRLPAPGRLAPGDRGAAQVRLEAPLAALPGDRFVLRRYSPVATLGGGVIVDVDPPRWRRGDPRWPARVASLAAGDPGVRLALSAEVAGAGGVALTKSAVRLGLAPDEARVLARALAAGAPGGVEPVALLGGDLLVCVRDLAALQQALQARLSKAHEDEPLAPGLSAERLRAAVAPEWPADAFRDWLGRLVERGVVALEGDAVRLATHAVGLDAGQQPIYERMMRVLDDAGLQALAEDDWLRRADAGARGRTLAVYAFRRGDAVRLLEGSVVGARAWRGLIARLRSEAAAGRDSFEVPEFKEWFGLTRKHAIPLLAKLDDQGVTQRVGNRRRVRPG